MSGPRRKPRSTIVAEFWNPTPYRQVAAILRARIEAGELAPKQRLPSIADLVQECGIARTTASKALRVLADEGLAEVVPGWGTYVTNRP